MTTIGAFDAKTHLSALLKRVAKGETIQITVRGVPVANLVPATATQQRNPAEAARKIRALRKGVTLGKSTIRDLINEGRRY